MPRGIGSGDIRLILILGRKKGNKLGLGAYGRLSLYDLLHSFSSWVREECTYRAVKRLLSSFNKIKVRHNLDPNMMAEGRSIMLPSRQSEYKEIFEEI